MTLLDSLNWRYAAKSYQKDKKVSEDKIQKIVEAARMAPSSYGIQPYKVIVVSNEELKEKMKPIAWDQRMVSECSHILIFAAWEKYTSERVHQIFDYTTDQRELPRGTAFGLHTEAIANSQIEMNDADAFVDTSKQACIALGLAAAQAGELQVDNTPMGGFDNEGMDELLSLKEKGLKSVYLLALGYRNEKDDWLVNLKKVRTPIEEFLIEYK